jgi:hypothetical protein
MQKISKINTKVYSLELDINGKKIKSCYLSPDDIWNYLSFESGDSEVVIFTPEINIPGIRKLDIRLKVDNRERGDTDAVVSAVKLSLQVLDKIKQELDTKLEEDIKKARQDFAVDNIEKPKSE